MIFVWEVSFETKYFYSINVHNKKKFKKKTRNCYTNNRSQMFHRRLDGHRLELVKVWTDFKIFKIKDFILKIFDYL